jgi:serine/threonine protein kinase
MSEKKMEVTNFQHVLHVDTDLKWEFDPSVKAEDVFETVKEIGKGGFGAVLLLRHTPSGMLLAGKVVNPDVMTKTARDSLFYEIGLMKKIVSPYTIKYYGSITYHGSPMVLMEYCDRGSIRDLIDYRNVCLTEKQASIVIHDLLSALQILHSKYHILHRDIKAANILLNSKQQIRITDFGVSREFSNKSKMVTVSITGTPYWMAPEVINGTPYSFPADIWSVGATAVELIEGAPPYCELEPTKAMIKIAKNGFPGFRAPKAISKEFKDFISHCMSRDPEKRCGIAQLLKHPWITQSETLDRSEVLRPWTDTEIDHAKLMDMIGEEGEPGTHSQWIATARITLRGYRN